MENIARATANNILFPISTENFQNYAISFKVFRKERQANANILAVTNFWGNSWYLSTISMSGFDTKEEKYKITQNAMSLLVADVC